MRAHSAPWESADPIGVLCERQQAHPALPVAQRVVQGEEDVVPGGGNHQPRKLAVGIDESVESSRAASRSYLAIASSSSAASSALARPIPSMAKRCAPPGLLGVRAIYLRRVSTRGGVQARAGLTFTKERILDGRIAGGDPMSEGEIADAVRVSRTPVREAFLRLDPR